MKFLNRLSVGNTTTRKTNPLHVDLMRPKKIKKTIANAWVNHVFISSFLLLLACPGLGWSQVVILTNAGKTYNNTANATRDTYGPVTVDKCSSVNFSVNFNFSGPFAGSGANNMESNDECNGCLGDPNDPLGAGCSPCWDFFFVQFLVDNVEVGRGLIGAGDNRQSGLIELNGFKVVPGSSVSIKISTHTWDMDESITFSDIQITGNAVPAKLIPLVGEPFCETRGNISLIPSQNGLEGIWSGSVGVIGSDFNTTVAGPGTHLLRFVPNADQCATPNTISVKVVSPSPVPLDKISFCRNRGNVDIPLLSSPISGIWSGIGVSANKYNTNTNVNSVELTFTPTPGQCYTANTVTVAVNSPTSPTFKKLGPFCQNQIYQLPTTDDNGVVGGWTGTGVTNNVTLNTGVGGTGVRNLTFTPGGGQQCALAGPVSITILDRQWLDTIADVKICGNYTLPTLSGTSLSGNQAYYTAPNGGGTKYTSGQTVSGDLRLYAFDQVPGCFSERSFLLDTLSPPQIDSLPDTTACGSLQLPLITGKNLSPNVAYYGGRNGAGTRFLPGQTLGFSGNFFMFDQKAGCSAERLYRVSITSGPRIGLGIKRPISCNGSKDGALDLKINNSLPPVTIRWNQTTFNNIEDPTNLGPGTYTVTVTDGTACAVSASVTLIEPATMALTCAVNKTVAKVGGKDGEARISISGGTARYRLKLDGPVMQVHDSLKAGAITLSGLSAGAYQVLVKDSLGCMDSCKFTITEPICSLSANIIRVKSILCNGNNSGVLTASVRNGRAPFTYLWSNGVGTISRDTLKNLGAGTYTLTLTDNLGCTDTAQITLTQPPPLVANCEVTSDVSSVGGSDGQAKLKYSGGTGAIALDWGGSQPGSVTASGRDSISLGSLPPRTYTPNFIDVNGCQTSCSFTIKEPVCSLQASLATKSPTCQGDANGQVIVEIASGTAPYTFQWSNGGPNKDTLTNLAAGAYQVTLTDAINCRLVLDTVLQDPTALTFSCQIVRNVITVKGKEGIARVSFSGGVAPYFIRVQGPVSSVRTESNSGSVDLTGWSAGNYTVIISDVNGCLQNCSFSLSDPICNLTLQLQGINPLCTGAANGQISVAVNRGKAPFKYDWSDNANDGQATARNLRAGIYSVLVSDSIGCVEADTLLLAEPSALSLTCGTPVPTTTVGGQNGRMTLRFSGGTKPYKLLLSGTKRDSFLNVCVDSFTVNNLSKGDYSLTLLDKNGCTVQGCNFRINDPVCNLVLTLTPTNNLCAGASQGSIQSSVTGGIGPFNYDWSDNRFDGNSRATGLPIGTFQLIVTDAKLCRDTASVSITEPAPLETICSVVNQPNTLGGSDGRGRVVIRGGTGQRNIQLSGPSPGQMHHSFVDTFNFSNLVAGNYSVRVTDANGCTDTCSFTLQNITCKLVGTAQGINPDCNGTSTGSIRVTLTGNNGAVTYAWNNAALRGVNPTDLAAGTYTVTLTDAAACKDTVSITLNNPTKLTLTATPASQPTPARPIGGSIALTYAGGTPAYRINWSPNGSDQSIGNSGAFTIPNLRAGTYAITLTDSNGCNALAEATLSEQACKLSIDIAATPADCGSKHLNTTVTSGTGPFQYAWNAPRFNGQANPRNATPGTYTVTVTDAIGCSAKDSLVLTLDSSTLNVSLVVSNPLCPGDLGAFTLRNVSGGQGPFTLSLNNTIQRFNNPPLSVRNLSPGTFALNITNASGCSFDTTITIQSPRSLSLELGPDTTLRRGAKVTFKPQLNFTPSQISWSPPTGLSSAQSLNAQAEPAFTTTYTLQLSDSAGCKVSDKIQVLVAGQVEAYFPNAFSPNGDEVNDYFSGYGGDEIEALEYLRIFDRWGQLVFEGVDIPVDDPTKGWDGTSRGQAAPIGSYVFSSVVRMKNGSRYSKAGELNLVR